MSKDKVITLCIPERTFKVIQDFAANQSLNVNAYLNSVIDSYVEWFIPVKSFEPVTIPKK
jgi:predicted DNA binding CopG/RHH family protein